MSVMVLTLITIAAILIGLLAWRRMVSKQQHPEPASSADRLDLNNPNYDGEDHSPLSCDADHSIRAEIN